MAFAILTFDKVGHKHVRDEHRAAHYAHLEKYMDRLIVSGGLRDDADEEFIGGMIVFDTNSIDEVYNFVDTDPFTIAGLFDRVEIVRWRPAFFDRKRV